MSGYNGSGVFVRAHDWTTDAGNGVKIRADRMDEEFDAIKGALDKAVLKDGQQTITADLPMATYKLTGLGAGSAAGHSVRWEQVFEGASKTAEVTVASDAGGTTNILGAASDIILISGTNTITSFGTGTNKVKVVRFSGALTLTHHGTTLILPGGANITTAAGDTCVVVSDGSSNARVYAYQRASGQPVVPVVDTANSPGAGEWAKFTDSNTLEGRTASELKADLDLEIGTDLQAYDADTLKADTADVLTAGFAVTAYNAGTQSSGTYTPDEANGNHQYAVNGGAHTLAPPSNNCSIVVHYTNNGSAGAITTSGFTKVDGDALTTTDTHEFICYITKVNDVSHLTVVALQ